MEIYTYLKKDHQKVNKLFKELIAASDKAQRLALFNEIKLELTLHAESERVTFYAALNKNAKSKEEVEHAKEEHKEMKSVLNKITKLDPDSPPWLIELGVLKSIVEHHVKEEEATLFDTARKIVDKTRANELVEEMEQKKQALLKKLKKL